MTAWQHISPAVDVKGLKNCCISRAAVGTDVDMLWNGIKGNENIRSECEEDVGTDCEDTDSDSDW
jgi:hypothetical protein